MPRRDGFQEIGASVAGQHVSPSHHREGEWNRPPGLSMKAADLVHQAKGPALATDARNRVLAWNPPAHELFGYDASHAKGKSFYELIRATDSFGNRLEREGLAFFEMITRGEPINGFELHAQKKSGEAVRVSIAVVVVIGPTPVEYHLVYLMRPLFRRRRADEAIERLLRIAPEGSLDLITALRGTAHRNGPDLTRREVQVLRLVADGDTNEEIAEALNVSFHTVRSHIQSLLRKLDVHSKAEAVSKAFHDHLL
jgi:DNA-binding CsgD family transcriptional regulator